MKLSKITIFMLLALFILGCKSLNKKKVYYSFNGVISEFQITDSIKVLVLAYSNGCACTDSTNCFSVCFGLDTSSHEIFEIRTLCAMDTTIRIGQIRNVKQNYGLDLKGKKSYEAIVKIIRNREIIYSPLHALNGLRTIYGIIY